MLHGAHRGIPEVWIVDLSNGELHWYRAPLGGNYSMQGSSKMTCVMRLAALPEVAIDLGALFPGRSMP